MMPPGWTPPGYWNGFGRKADGSFGSGLTGCLGAGAAFIVVLVVLLLLASR